MGVFFASQQYDLHVEKNTQEADKKWETFNRIRKAQGWLIPPPTIDRPYLVLGYGLYVWLGSVIAIIGVPSLITATSDAYARTLGYAIIISALLSAVFALKERWYIFECFPTLLIAICLAAYCGATFRTVVETDGTFDEARAALSVTIFIVTALMWGRGLTLLRRYLFARALLKVRE